MKRELVVGSVWQYHSTTILKVVVDVCDTHVGYKYVISSDGRPRTAEQPIPEFLEHHHLFYKPQ